MVQNPCRRVGQEVLRGRRQRTKTLVEIMTSDVDHTKPWTKSRPVADLSTTVACTSPHEAPPATYVLPVRLHVPRRDPCLRYIYRSGFSGDLLNTFFCELVVDCDLLLHLSLDDVRRTPRVLFVVDVSATFQCASLRASCLRGGLAPGLEHGARTGPLCP